MMSVGVVVTTYNRPDALKKVLDGLLSQTRPPDTIVIADDGSGPGTRTMLAPYLSDQNVKIRHVWHEDRGFRAAMIRNRAILEAKSDYIVLLDGDCIPSRHFIADHASLARRGCFFQGKRVLVSEKASDSFEFSDTLFFSRLLLHAAKKNLSNSHHIIRIPYFPAVHVSRTSGVRSCNMGVFRNDILAVNGFNHDFTGWGREDTEFVIRLTRYGLKRKEHPFKAICFHLWHRQVSRDHLPANDDILAGTMAATGFRCRQGIDSL